MDAPNAYVPDTYNLSFFRCYMLREVQPLHKGMYTWNYGTFIANKFWGEILKMMKEGCGDMK